MLTFPTSIIKPGSWRDRWYKFVRFLEYPSHYGKLKEISSRLRKADYNSQKAFHLKFPEDYPADERMVLCEDGLPEPIIEQEDGRIDNPRSYFMDGDKKYYLRDKNNVVRAYLVNSEDMMTQFHMAWLPETDWIKVDKYKDLKFSNWGRWCKVLTVSRAVAFRRRLKLKLFDTGMKCISFFYRVMHTIDSTWLCLRYPFLYPRNRFTGKHYNNWKLSEFSDKINKKNTFIVDVVISDDMSSIPSFAVGTKSPEITVSEIPDPDYPDHVKVIREISTGAGKYVIMETDMKGVSKRYPVKIGDVLAIYDIERDAWVSLEKQKYNEYSFLNKDKDSGRTVRTYMVVRDQFMSWISKAVMLFHDKVLCTLFCIPTRSELDEFPDGWLRAFGMDMMEELRAQLKKEGRLRKLRIMQIKEKYGDLRFYVDAASGEVHDIISKYENISATTCIACGKPARYITSGWICPYCEDCISPDSVSRAMDLQKPVEHDDEHSDFVAGHI